jgi:hypothetical protein
MPAISDYIVTDDLTILLALIAATTFLLNNLYKPQPLVHPILLGRQSDVGRARNPGESAVYRNYGTGLMGRVCAHVMYTTIWRLTRYSFLSVPARRLLFSQTSSSLSLRQRAPSGLQRFGSPNLPHPSI